MSGEGLIVGFPNGISSHSIGKGRVEKIELLALAIISLVQWSHWKGLY